MSTLVGFYVSCTLTLWLYIPGLNKKLPHTGEFSCKVLAVNEEKVKTGLPTEFQVDCSEDIAWLKSDHPEIFWTRSCNE